MRAEDWPAVRAIYEQGIATRQATFETEAPAWEAWDAGHLAEPRLVAEEDGAVVGWAALSPVSRRACYAGVVEESVYVAEGARGQGIGIALLARLCSEAMPPESGRSRPRSSRRTSRASSSTAAAAFAWSALASGSRSSTASGATPFSSSAGPEPCCRSE